MDTILDARPKSPGSTAAVARLYRRLLTSQHLRDNLLLLGANSVGALCGYLLQVLLGHRLGLAAYGAVASLLAVAAAILIPTQVIGTIVARYSASLSSAGKLAELNDLIRRLSTVLLLVGCGVTAFFALGSHVIAAFLHLDSTQAVIVIGVMFALSFVAPVNIGAVQGLQRFSWYAALVALPMVLRLVLASVLVDLGFGVDGAMLGILLGIFLAYVVSFQPLRALLQGPRRSCGTLRFLGSYSITATLTLTMTVVLGNWDTPLARHFLSARQAGLYAAMAIVGKIMLVVSNSIVMVMFPKFAVLHSRGEHARRAVLEALLSVLGPCLALQAVYYVAPALVMRVLYGPSFVAVAPQLAWYGVAMLLLGLAQVLIFYFLSINERLFMLTLLIAGGVQGILVVMRHQSVGQLVQASVTANAVLVLALLALLVVRMSRAQHAHPGPP